MFFSLLKENKINTVVDIRLNNKSQLAGLSKGEDLRYFLNEICSIEYKHDPDLAPSKEILSSYKDKKISWQQYEKQFSDLLFNRISITVFILFSFNREKNTLALFFVNPIV